MGFSSAFAATYGAMKQGQVADAQVGRLDADTAIAQENLDMKLGTNDAFAEIAENMRIMSSGGEPQFTSAGGSSVSPNRPGKGFHASAASKGAKMKSSDRMGRSRPQTSGTGTEGYGAVGEDAGYAPMDDPYAMNGPDGGGADMAAGGIGGGEGMDFSGMYESSKRLKERRHNAVKSLGTMY